MSLALRDPGLLRTQAHIDGQWIDADSGERLAVLNPATGATIVVAPLPIVGGTGSPTRVFALVER